MALKKALRKALGRSVGFEVRLELLAKALASSRSFEFEPGRGPRAEVLEQGSETRDGPKVWTILGPVFALGCAGLLIYSQGPRDLFRAVGIFQNGCF